MGSSFFINGALAWGVALAAIPVIIHLVMRQPPKRVIFPALQLIRQRHKRSTKRLKIKNWLLLLARMALVALMALALARPRLSSTAPIGDREVPSAIALVFDTSLSMEYAEKDNTSRLDEAKKYALGIVRKTPSSSRVFVIDSAKPGMPIGLSPSAARKRIEGLTLDAARRPLNDALGQAYAAVAESDRPRHEVYVLTDLARSAWDLSRRADGLDKARADKIGVATYVLRLSPKELRDVAIVEAEARPSASVPTEDEPVEIRGKVRSTGPRASRVVEFHLDGKVRDKRAIDLPVNGEVEVRFRSPKLAVGPHQGSLILGGGRDPLPFDDRRFFTFQVEPAFRVLVVSDVPDDAFFVVNALDPAELPAGEPRPYKVERIGTSQLASLRPDAKPYDAIILLNVRALSEADWSRLNGYVHNGGGLMIALGHRVDPRSYNGPVATQVLPATLDKVQDLPPPGTSFGKADLAHPLFDRAPQDLNADLSGVPVAHAFGVVPTKTARTLLVYQNNTPALLERTFPGAKTGHVLLWTTALARDPARPSTSWTDFPRHWSFLYLVDRAVPYLAGVGGESLNYEAGQDVYLPIDPSQKYTTYIVQGPDKKTSDRLGAPLSKAALVIEAPQAIGPWTVTATGPGVAPQPIGFSVNPPLAETEILPLETKDLDALFGGKDRYKLADDPEALKKAVGEFRNGFEIFPWLMLLILILVTAENYLANKFHRERATTPR